MPEAAQTNEAPKAKRTALCEKVYTNGTDEFRHVKPDVTKLTFKFANGSAHALSLGQFPEAIQLCLAWHGLAQKCGDAYAGDKTVEDAEQSFLSIVEQLEGGEFTSGREGVGPRPSMVVEAVVAALQAKGEVVDDARRASIAEKLKGADNRKAALANPVIAAQYERIKLAAQQARADEAAKKAEGATLGDF